MYQTIISSRSGDIEVNFDYDPECGEITNDRYYQGDADITDAVNGLRENGFIERLDEYLTEKAEELIKEREEQDRIRAWPMDAFENAKHMYG